jgi:hypothetical protein
MSSPPHPPWFNHPNNISRRIQVMKVIIMQFSAWNIFLPFGPNMFLNTLFWKILRLCSSPKVRDQLSHPYSTTGKITVFYILILRFFDIRREDKDFGTNDSRHSLNLIYSWFPHECQSDLLLSPPSTWILPHFQTIHLLSLYSGSILKLDET